MTDEPLDAFGNIIGVTSDREELEYRQIINMMGTSAWYGSCSTWYSSLVEPTIDGMLGGLSYVHKDEVEWTTLRLKQLASDKAIKTNTCLDCGGGIGRVSHYALKPVFQHVDMIEGCELFVQASTTNFARNSIRARYNLELQDIEALQQQFRGTNYDVVFLQWVIGHLVDRDVVRFLKFAKDHLLTPSTGRIIMKENCIISDGFFLDKEDINLIRNLDMIKDLCSQAGLTVLTIDEQPTWPSNLYPIRFFVLASSTSNESDQRFT